jgi:uncharacterized protein
MDETLIILFISFFAIALIYASVGFGGGSSYLGLLAIMNLPMQTIRPTALLCNIIVVSAGTYIFWKEGYVEIKKCWPFIIASIPLAFLGGYFKIDESTFFIVLGFSLVIAAILLWIQPEKLKKVGSESTVLNFGLGGSIGFLSGLVGIGGGIFLSPILHLINWDNAKKISALASLFILANSISGLAGQLTRSVELDWKLIIPLLIAVFAGGQIGSRLGAKKFNPLYIKRITAILVLIAGANILKDYLFTS